MTPSPGLSATDPTASSAALPIPMDPAAPLLNQYLPGHPEEAEGGPTPPHVKAEDGGPLRLVKTEEAEGDPSSPPQQRAEDGGPLHLIKPENIRSRFWVYFHKYDLEYHPDKKNTARCDICGKDISVKQGTGGLKNHLKFKHPEQYAELFVGDDTVRLRPTVAERIEMQIAKAKGEAGTPSRTADGPPPQKKPRGGENAYQDITMRRDADKRSNEKHWMEMWSMTRREIRELRKELREEKDEGARRDLEGDLRVMEKKKADYAELLGYENVILSATAEEV